MAALIYALVSIALLLGVVSLDNAITRLFWQVHWPTWTVACEDFLSSWSVGIAVGAALLAAVWHDWRARRNRPSAVLHLLIVLLAQAVLIQALKYGIGRARPCDVAVNAWVFVGPNSQYNGFPSGHFTAVAACALVLLRFNRPIGLFLLLWAALTAWARMFSDAHFASDLVAGLLIACAVERFVAARAAVQGSSHPRRRAQWRWAGVVIGVAICGLGTAVVRGINAIPPDGMSMTEQQRIDAVVGLYERGMGRTPTPDEMQVYVDRLEILPEAKPGVIKEFGFSTEFYRRIEREPAASARVTMLYRLVANRSPTADEISDMEIALSGHDARLRSGIRLSVFRLSYAAQ